jgi:hypothetical protein
MWFSILISTRADDVAAGVVDQGLADPKWLGIGGGTMVAHHLTYPSGLDGFSRREHRLDARKKELTFLAKYLPPEFGGE